MGKSSAVFNISILSGFTTGQKKIQADEVVIGRMDDCALTIEHPDVSRRHLVLKAKNGQIIVEDLGSSNGTFVNGNKLQPKTPHVIQSSDQVKLGRVIALKIEFESTDEAYAAAAGVIARPPPRTPPTERPVLEIAPPLEIPAPAVEAKASTLPVERQRSEPMVEKPKIVHPVVQDAQKKADRMLEVARKQAAQMVQEAERDAEGKVQSFYERARKTEDEANELYKQRLSEAHAESSRIFEDAKNEGRVLVQDARKQAQAVRDQAEKFAAQMQTETYKKMADLIHQGEQQAQEICLQKGREADEYLQQKEKELIKEVYARLQEECEEQRNRLAIELDGRERDVNSRIVVAEKKLLELIQKNLDQKMKFDETTRDSEKVATDLDSKRMQLESVRAELAHLEETSVKTRHDLETATAKAKLEFETTSAKSKLEFETNSAKAKAEFEAASKKAKQELADAHKLQTDIDKDLKDLSTRQTSLKSEVEKLSLQKARLDKEIEQHAHHAQVELKAIKGRLDEERGRVEKEEQQRLDESKLETIRTMQKLEKEMLMEIQSNKDRLTREILLLTESTLTGEFPSEKWRKLEPELHDKVLQVLHSPSAADQSGNTVKPSANLARARKKEKFNHVVSGLTIGAVLSTSLIFGHKYLDANQAPVESQVAKAREQQRKELEARKFNPPQNDELRDTYVDSVIYTKGFVALYSRSDFQNAWGKKLSYHMLKTFQVSEDKSMQAIARIAALVKTLEEKKGGIHPDFVEKGLGQMRELEKTTMAEISKDLGSIVRLEALKKQERIFIENFQK